MKNEQIFDLLKEVREDQKELRNSLSEHHATSVGNSKELGYFKENLNKNNLLLERLTKTVELHEMRSTSLEKIVNGSKSNIGHSDRISALEVPVKAKDYWLKSSVKWSALIASIIGILATIAKVLGLI